MALYGVEAIYASSTTGVLNQVADRAQLLLRPRTKFKRDLSRMYMTRSSLVHGALGFPPAAFPFEAPEGYKKRRRSLSDASELGVALLVATLQELASRDWSEVNFPAKLDGGALPFEAESSNEVGYSFVRYRASALEACLQAELLDP